MAEKKTKNLELKTSEWIALAYHFYMPRYLPEKLDNVDKDIVPLFLKFIEETENNSLDFIIKSLDLWTKACDKRFDETSFRKILKSNNEAIIPFFLPNHNSLLCFQRQSNSVTVYGIDLQYNENEDIGKATYLMCNENSILYNTKIAIPRSVVETNLDFLLSIDKDFINLINESPSFTEINKAQKKVPDNRKLPKSGLVFDWFIPSLMGTFQKTEQILKTTRIDQNFESDKPWRRSSSWIALKSFIHFALANSKIKDSNRIYKMTIIQFLTWYLTKLKISQYDEHYFEIIRDCLKKLSLKMNRFEDDFGKNEELLQQCLKNTSQINLEVNKVWKSCYDDFQSSNKIDLDKLKFDVKETIVDFKNFLLKEESQNESLDSFNLPPISPISDYSNIPIDEKLKQLYQDLNNSMYDDRTQALWNVEKFVQNFFLQYEENGLHAINSKNLLNLLSTYINKSKETYQKTAFILKSEMILTSGIIVALLDHESILLDPFNIVKDYDIPIELITFQFLHINTELGIKCVFKLENYFKNRKENATEKGETIFSFSKTGLPNQYAKKDAAMATWIRKLQEENETKKQEKREEVKKKKAKYEDHRRNLDRDHEARYCSICNMSISVYEEALPQSTTEKNIVAFNMCMSKSLRDARDSFIYFIDLFFDDTSNRRVPYIWNNWYMNFNTSIFEIGEIKLGSKTKPFIKTHYKEPSVTEDEDSFIVPLGLKLSCYAFKDQEFDFKYSPAPLAIQLDNPYDVLQWTIQSVEHHQNQVISKQEDCPQDLNLLEYIQFGSLRSDGGMVQLRNLLLSIQSNTLSFHEKPVVIAIQYLLTQVGPKTINDNTPIRDWKLDFKNDEFVKLFCESLNSLVDVVEKNWKYYLVIHMVQFITCSMLLIPENRKKTFLTDLLKKCRKILSSYLEDISDSKKNREVKQLEDDELGILEVLLFSFDCDSQLALASNDDIFIYLKTLNSMRNYSIIHSLSFNIECIRVSLSKIEYLHKYFLKENGRNINEILRRLIEDLWNPAKSGKMGSWKRLEHPRNSWYSTTFDSRSLQFDILSGSFLINGAPISCLPSQIANHPLYRSIFEHKSFTIYPDKEPRTYVTKNKYKDSRFKFTSLTSKDIKIQEEIEKENLTLELLPKEIFTQISLPHQLVAKFSHWYIKSQNKIVFRESNWENLSMNFKYEILLDKNYCGSICDVESRQKILPISSPSFQFLYQQFLNRIEDTKYIYAFFVEQNSQLELFFHRHNFHIDINLKSEKKIAIVRELGLNGMKISENQSFGTLIGLNSCLLITDDKTQEKKVIIPFVTQHETSKTNEGQTILNAKWNTLQDSTYLVYDIHPQLSQLKSSALLSWLYLSYLHAITSNSFKDPMTNLTGIESAILLLKRCKKNSPFDSQCIVALELIVVLSPVRKDHAFEGTGLETTRWSIYGIKSSHDLLGLMALSIWKYSLELKHLFSYSTNEKFEISESIIHSVRAYVRNKYYYTPEFWIPKNQLQISFFDQEILRDLSKINRVIKVALIDEENSPSSRFFIESMISSFEFGSQIYFINRTPNNLKNHFKQLYENALEVQQGLKSIRSFRLLSTKIAMEYEIEEDFFETFFAIAKSSTLMPNSQNIVFQSERFHFQDRDFNAKVNYRYYDQKNSIIKNLKDSFMYYCLNEVPQREVWPGLEDKSIISKCDENPYPDLKEKYRIYYERKCFKVFLDNLKKQLPQNSPVSLSKINEIEKSLKLITLPPLVKRNDTFYIKFNFTDQQQNQEANEIYKTGRFENIESLFMDCIINPQISDINSNRDSKKGLQLPPLEELQKKLENAKKSFEEEDDEEIKANHLSTIKALESKIQLSKEQMKNLPAFPLSKKSSSPLSARFNNELEESWNNDQLKKEIVPQLKVEDYVKKNLEKIHEISQAKSIEYLGLIEKNLDSQTTIGKLFQESGLWICISKTTILPKLSQNQNKNPELNANTLALIASYVVFLNYQQKSQRCLIQLETLKSPNEKNKLANEILNKRETWNPQQYPEWLLFELEQDINIRKVQAEVAFHMANQRNENYVTQLNMGEGKSSVIIPMLCAHLAKNPTCVMVTVLTSLFNTNFNDLFARFSGLLRRSIYIFPFHRDIPLDKNILTILEKQYKEAQLAGDIILTVPEYKLSFELKFTESILKKDKELSEKMKSILIWNRENVFNLLDESDALLGHKYQLIYPIGTQEAIDGGDKRWKLIQDILSIIQNIGENLSNEFPENFEFKNFKSKSTWPYFRITNPNQADVLLDRIVDLLFSESKFSKFDSEKSNLAKTFIRKKNLSEEDGERILERLGDSKIDLLILRGLISYDIVIHCLRKRWSVDYGVNKNSIWKKLSAVPYRAKDTASERTEFGHPDIAIFLTLLSYYYQGLSKEQFTLVLSKLKKEKNKTEYQAWVDLDSEIIESCYHSLDGINLSDFQQMDYLFQIFHKNMKTINYWLGVKVFPTETKIFQYKLGANAWDLALSGKYPTRGFSGTKDNYLLLPISIYQKNLPHLTGTDGRVIFDILREENKQYFHLEKSSPKMLLSKMKEFGTSVLIDCGAFMIDYSNLDVVKEWMSLDPTIEGGVYFEGNDLMIVNNICKSSAFHLSPLRHRLGSCVIYLDDHHTRGKFF